METERNAGTPEVRQEPTEKLNEGTDVKTGVEEIAFRSRELAVKEARGVTP